MPKTKQRYVKYTKDVLEEAVKNSTSICSTCKFLNCSQTGNSYYHIKNLINQFNVDTSHFFSKWQRKGEICWTKKNWQHYLILSTKNIREKASLLKRSLIEYGREYQCEVCKNIGEWQGKELSLEIDHIDGNWKNNTPENIRFLCHNCHSQTDNYGSKKNRKVKVKKQRKRKVENRPAIEVLKKEIEELGYCGCGRKYGVSDNAVRKWIKNGT